MVAASRALLTIRRRRNFDMATSASSIDDGGSNPIRSDLDLGVPVEMCPTVKAR